MKLNDYIRQLELLIIAWENGEAELNSMDIKAIKMLLENRKEAIEFLKKEKIRLVKEVSAKYEDFLGNSHFINEVIYSEICEILSKIEKE